MRGAATLGGDPIAAACTCDKLSGKSELRLSAGQAARQTPDCARPTARRSISCSMAGCPSRRGASRALSSSVRIVSSACAICARSPRPFPQSRRSSRTACTGLAPLCRGCPGSSGSLRPRLGWVHRRKRTSLCSTRGCPAWRATKGDTRPSAPLSARLGGRRLVRMGLATRSTKGTAPLWARKRGAVGRARRVTDASATRVQCIPARCLRCRWRDWHHHHHRRSLAPRTAARC